MAAAGNEDKDTDTQPHYPSSYDLDNIVAIAATDHNDQKASFSNFGKRSVDLGAPGDDIYSTVPGGSYGFLSGTSMASPHVAGAAALLLADAPDLTNMEVKWRLLKGTDPIGLQVLTGGRLNAYNSLKLVSDVTIEVTPLGPTTIHPGDSFDYQVIVTNLSGAPKTVTAMVLARHPNGRERVFRGPSNFSLAGGGTVNQTFTETVPMSVPPALFGPNRLVGRAFTSGFGDFDEDEETYDLSP